MYAGNAVALQACTELLSDPSIPITVTLALRNVISSQATTVTKGSVSSAATKQESPSNQQEPDVVVPAQQAASVTRATAANNVQGGSAVISMMMHAAVRPLTPFVPDSAASTSDSSVHGMLTVSNAQLPEPDYATHGSHGGHWSRAFAGNLLTSPCFVASLSPGTQSELTTSSVMAKLLTALKQLADAGTSSTSTVREASNQATAGMPGPASGQADDKHRLSSMKLLQS